MPGNCLLACTPPVGTNSNPSSAVLLLGVFGCRSASGLWWDSLPQRENYAAFFIWGSFVTTKPAPRDLDVLLIMDENFEVGDVAGPAREVFDSMRAKLLFESDVFWARASIGDEVLGLWLDTYQTSRSFQKRGIVELELP